MDCRKDGNTDLKAVKNKYKSYLKDLIVERKVEENIRSLRKPKASKNKTVAYYATK